MFKKLPSNSRKLLQEIIAAENPTKMLCNRFENCSAKEDEELRSLIRELIQEGYIRIPRWGDNMPLYVQINNSGRTYFEREAEYGTQIELAFGKKYNIGSIIANGGNLILGDIVNSSLNIDNSIKHIAIQIEEKGGEDKENLKALLEETKKLLEKIEETRQIPKDKDFLNRLSSHTEKHGWLYGEILGLVGNVVLKMIQG